MGLNIGLRLWLPQDRLVGVPWLVPAIEAATARRAAHRRPRQRREPRETGECAAFRSPSWSCSFCGALLATALLIYHLITGSEVTESPGPLLAAGALVWLGNNLSFALLYWLIDGGGPIARARRAGPGRLRVHAAAEPRARAARLEAGLPRLPAPRLHERDGVQPHRCDAADPPCQVHDARAVDGRARALRPDRRASRQRVHLTPAKSCLKPQLPRSHGCADHPDERPVSAASIRSSRPLICRNCSAVGVSAPDASARRVSVTRTCS